MAPAPRRRLWRFLNEPREFDSSAIRVCCLVLAVAFGGITVLRTLETGGPGFLIPRAAMLAYALAGAIACPRLGWRGLRAYTVGLALILPLTASYVIGSEGFRPADVTFWALATFVPYVFLLNGWDFVLASALLVVGQTVILQLLPEPITPRWTLWGVQLGTMALGTAAGVLLMTFRGLIAESREWWQASHARERTLREFAEVTSAAMTSDTALATFAESFARTAPGSASAFIVEQDDGTLRLVGSAGIVTTKPSHRLRRTPEIAALTREPRDEPWTHRDLPPGGLEALATWLGVDFFPGGAVLLPLGDLVRGTVILLVTHERHITSEALLVWTAMAYQSAVTIANLRAWEILRAQEAEARQVAVERIEIAELRSRFVTQASHEFRTPLAVIRAAAEMLERYGERLTPAQREQKLGRIRDAVGHMTSLLDDVLMLGKVEAQARDMARETIDLAALCRSVLAEVQVTALASHQLRLRCADDGVRLAVDPTVMRSVVGNLLTNAVKYSPAGGPVDLSLERRDGTVVLRVCDQGIGIPEEDRDQLFESFRRAANVAAIPGSGLGLAIVQRGIEAHGGTIRIESTVGVGTTVEVALPAPGESSGDPRAPGESSNDPDAPPSTSAPAMP